MGEPLQMSIGLNPLGMRTASEQIFTALLPGMNVVTLRIRYYSFYCWLLQRYYATRERATLSDLRRHVRTSELLLALIHVACGRANGVPGTQRAGNILSTNEENIDFLQDAIPDDKDAKSYWDGVNGILGSYYVVALQELNLIKPLADNARLYNVTPYNETTIAGEEMAEAFGKSVAPVSDLFESCARTGRVSREELLKMAPYFQMHEMGNSEERSLLLQVLLQPDRVMAERATHFRRGTLRLLLRFLRDMRPERFSEIEFAQYVYQQFAQGQDRSIVAMGWYAYHLNDRRQYASLCIFNELLTILTQSDAPGQWETIATLTAQLADDVVSALNCDTLTVAEALQRWLTIIPPEQKMAQAFYNLLDDYRQNEGFRDTQKRIKEAGITVTNDALNAFADLESHRGEPLVQYIQRFLTEKIIYNHYAEAMRKYCLTGVATHKLTIESGRVKGLALYEPSHSTPRVGTLYEFATDLALVKEAKITPLGIKTLSLLEDDNA